jgi:hypothetical protein
VSSFIRFGVLAAIAACASVAAGPSARADLPWMSEDAMRGAFVGKTLDGYYVDGQGWTETYDNNGRLDYRDTGRSSRGYWFFRDHVFCTFYDPGQDINGGCFTAIQTSANCYEFYLAGLSGRGDGEEVEPGPLGRWVARAARRGEPSTCQARPTV